MKATTILFVTLSAIVAVSLIKADGPPMPEGMPDSLKTEFEAIKKEMEALPKDSSGRPDFSKIPDTLKARMEALKTNYEKETGKQFPMPPPPPSASS